MNTFDKKNFYITQRLSQTKFFLVDMHFATLSCCAVKGQCKVKVDEGAIKQEMDYLAMCSHCMFYWR
jgi:hypothetical protein